LLPLCYADGAQNFAMQPIEVAMRLEPVEIRFRSAARRWDFSPVYL
jgi:hypothetical protein